MKRLSEIRSDERVFTESDIESLSRSVYESVKTMAVADTGASTQRGWSPTPEKIAEVCKAIGGQIKVYIKHEYGHLEERQASLERRHFALLEDQANRIATLEEKAGKLVVKSMDGANEHGG